MTNDQRSGIWVVAPCSVVPPVELGLGVEALRRSGWDVQVHAQCRKRENYFAGSDSDRAGAFWEAACDPKRAIVLCARGGYGANRLLPFLDELSRTHGAPPRDKLLVGYSDITALMEFARTRWGWSILHAPMPSLRTFSVMPSKHWKRLEAWLSRTPADPAGSPAYRVKFLRKGGGQAVEGELRGGNLTVWNTLIGTPYMPKITAESLLFLEDVSESPARLDRAMHQLAQSGGLDRVKALLLGDFLDCHDRVPSVLATQPRGEGSRLAKLLSHPPASKLRPLRAPLSARKALDAVFGFWGDRLKIPVAYGLPIGHGPGLGSIPLGARVRLAASGELYLLDWPWLTE